MSSNDVLVWRALRFASERHADQRRKDVGCSPYINHVIAVVATLVEHGITDPATLAAAALHDTVEDTPTTLDDIEKHFGMEVRSLVAEMTDDKKLCKQKRKELQIDHAHDATPKAKQIKIADKICNVADVGSAPAVDWPLERRAKYVHWADQVMAGLQGQNDALEATYDATVRQTRGVLNALGRQPQA